MPTRLTSIRRRLLLGFALAALLLCGVASRTFAQAVSPTADAAGGLGKVTVKGARIAEVNSSHVRIAVDLTTIPSRTTTLENLRLTSLRLNGLPVFAEALAQPVPLVQGKETALPPIYVTAEFRDLTTVAPLRAMIEKQSVHVQGQIVADVRMNFVEKLAMHTEHPRISLAIAEDVPVAFSVTPFQRQAALGVLTVIELGMQGSSAARKSFPGLIPDFESPWVRELEEQAAASVVEIQSSYILKEHTESYPVTLDQLGFRLASGQILATAEVKAPWEYDLEFVGKIKSGDAKLVKGSTEVQLRPAGSQAAGDTGTPLLLTHKDFTLEERGSAEKDALIVEKGKREGSFGNVNVRRRASPDALAVIVLQAPPPTGGFPAAPAAIAQQGHWEKVALYRLLPDPASNKQSVEVVQLSARHKGNSILFDRPLDSSFYGSPVLVPEGVLGIVQDEQTGTFLPADLAGAPAPAAAN